LELFYTETSKSVKWLSKNFIPSSIYREYIESQTTNCAQSCNTLKLTVTSCDIKCKTRGILLSATNCGIAMSFRELYGSESCTQVALMFMDTLDSFNASGNYYYNQ
jgi:hypothetical protein